MRADPLISCVVAETEGKRGGKDILYNNSVIFFYCEAMGSSVASTALMVLCSAAMSLGKGYTCFFNTLY